MELNGAKILYTIHTNIPVLGDFKITQTLVSTWIVMPLLSMSLLNQSQSHIVIQYKKEHYPMPPRNAYGIRLLLNDIHALFL